MDEIMGVHYLVGVLMVFWQDWTEVPQLKQASDIEQDEVLTVNM